jgi:hypothetical protein
MHRSKIRPISISHARHAESDRTRAEERHGSVVMPTLIPSFAVLVVEDEGLVRMDIVAIEHARYKAYEACDASVVRDC